MTGPVMPATARRVARATRVAAAILGAAAAYGCGKEPVDRFRTRGATQADFADPGVDPMPGMDNGIKLTTAEIRGRNSWMIWTAGNEEFWDWLARNGYGSGDLLKTIDSRHRGTRFRDLGLMNDPGTRQATQPDSLGLWIDEIVTPEPAAIKRDVYGVQSGVLGLRLFPNPMFDAAARKTWDANRYYTDKTYYANKTLVRPYIVGMACGFCHVGPHPLNPPKDPENPKWENLSTTIGAQYFRTAPIFAPAMGPDNFLWQVLHAAREGTLDTSLIPSDQILNPSMMNAIFEIPARLSVGTPQHLGPGNMLVPGVKQDASAPHILKDGADGVGVYGALARVFVNIGEHWQQWITNHQVILGTMPQTPYPVERAVRNSDYWQATAARVPDIAAYFIHAAGAMHLADAPGGKAYLTKDSAVMTRGRMVFADNCAECHSSKRPPAGWDDSSDSAKTFFRASVNKSDFREGNYLGTDERLPVTAVRTNACRAAATNAMRGHVWDNFSSETYKASAAVDPIKVWNPYTADSVEFRMPAGGPGYYRPAPLVSIWATAPFFHNNSLGEATHDPSVAGRMKAFDDAVTRLLWPEKRADTASISRTTAESRLELLKSNLPFVVRALLRVIDNDTSAFLTLGPIPRGTPVGLLASAKLRLGTGDLAYAWKVAHVVRTTRQTLKRIGDEGLDSAQTRALMKQVIVPLLLDINNCPDFVEDQGHYYGTKLPDADKRALIEFLKTL